jgi:hypothetical protein
MYQPPFTSLFHFYTSLSCMLPYVAQHSSSPLCIQEYTQIMITFTRKERLYWLTLHGAGGEFSGKLQVLFFSLLHATSLCDLSMVTFAVT